MSTSRGVFSSFFRSRNREEKDKELLLKVIEQKTDNDELFNFSLESYKLNHYIIVKKNTNYFDDIRTEYENKFISKGKNINYVKVIKI